MKEQTTKEIIDEMSERINNCIVSLNALIANLMEISEDIEKQEQALYCVEKENTMLRNEKNTLEDELLTKTNPLADLKEIIEQAENADYGLKSWRTLETKQDLIEAIKKEVL